MGDVIKFPGVGRRNTINYFKQDEVMEYAADALLYLRHVKGMNPFDKDIKREYPEDFIKALTFQAALQEDLPEQEEEE